MPTTIEDHLRAAAQEALRANDNDVKKTAPKLARALMTNARRPLLIALISDYLSRLPPTAPRPMMPLPGTDKTKAKPLIGMPTAADKAGALAAMKMEAAEIFARRIRGAGKLGELHVHELRAIASDLGRAAVEKVKLGYNDAIDSVLIMKLSQHCVAADQNARVADVISQRDTVRAFEEAKPIAAAVLRDGMDAMFKSLTGQKLSKTKPLEIEGGAQP